MNRVLRLHVPFGCAVAFCLAAGWFELTRARAGHTIAWVYVVEWPLFALLCAGMWWHLATGRDVRRPSPPSEIDEDDPGLQAWRAYLAEAGHDVTADENAPGSG